LTAGDLRRRYVGSTTRPAANSTSAHDLGDEAASGGRGAGVGRDQEQRELDHDPEHDREPGHVKQHPAEARVLRVL
jgi:hypothetical protein